MEINWKRVDDYGIKINVACLVSLNPYFHSAAHLTVACLTASGKWKIGNGEVCWFEPIYFAYFNEVYEREE